MTSLDRLPTRNECPYVRHIVLHRPLEQDITDDHLWAVFSACTNLKTARFSGFVELSDRTVLSLVSAATDLEGIDLSHCRQVTDRSVLELAQCSRLSWVRLNGITGLSDPAVSALVKSLARLIDLELCGLPLLTPVAVRDVWTYSKKIRTLRLSHCSQLTDKAFPAPNDSILAPSFSNEFSASSLGAEGFSSPLSWLDLLPPLTLQHRASSLRVLDVSHCSKITDEAIAGIVQHAPKLQTLKLSGCTRLTDRAVYNICRLGEHLDTLTLAHLSEISDGAIIHLARSCPNIRSIDLTLCLNLTDMSIFELAVLPHLKFVNFCGLHRLTDNAVFFVAEHNDSLERIHLSYCHQITPESVHLLLKRRPTLQYLSVTGVPAFAREGIRRFSDAHTAAGPGRDQPQPASCFFSGRNVAALRRFLDKEQQRRQEAEAKCIMFSPRSDDGLELY